MANEVGSAFFRIFGDDHPFQRKILKLTGQQVPGKEVEVDADVSRLQNNIRMAAESIRELGEIDPGFNDSQIREAVRSLRGQIKNAVTDLKQIDNTVVRVDMDTGQVIRKTAAARKVVDAMTGRRHHLVVTADMTPAERAITRFRIAMQAGSEATHSFNQNVRTLHNVGRYMGRAALLSMLGALGPLTSGLLVAGGALANVAGGFGLLAAAAAPSIVALGSHEVAEERLETAMKSRDDAMKGVADAEENYGRAVEDGARRVREASKAYAQSKEDAVRAQRDAARTIADTHRAVADAERTLADAQREAEDGVVEAIKRHQDAREALTQAYADARERVGQAIQDAREAEQEYRQEIQETARANREAMQEIADAEQNLRETQVQARQDVRDAYAEYNEAVEQARETLEDNARKIVEARRRERDAAEDVEDAEFDLRQGREDVYRATQDLIDAQRDLNEAMREEPRRQAEAQIDLEEARLNQAETTREIANAQQELAEARMMGDTERAMELEHRLERLRLRQWRGAIDLKESEEALNDTRKNGSEELNRARDAVEDTWRQQRAAQQQLVGLQERLREAQEGVAEAARDTARAQREAAEATEDAQRRIIEAQRAIREAQRNGARDIREAALQVIEAEQAMIRTRQEGARSVEEARTRMIEAERDIVKAQLEGAEQIRDAQEQAREAYEGILQARYDGTRRIQEAQRGLADALRNQGYAIEDANHRVAQAHEQMANRAAELRFAQTEAADDISEANEQVAEAIEGVQYALEEMEEAAEKAGATLTASQQALWDQIQVFKEAYLQAMGPAGDVLNMLAVRALRLAQQTLPFFGRMALETATRVRDEFERMIAAITEPAQLQRFRDLLEGIPRQTEIAFAAAWNWAMGFLNLLGLAEPHTRNFWQWIKDAGQRFREWTQSVEGQSAIRQFFDRTLPVLGRLLNALGTVVAGFFKLSTSPAALQFFDYVAGIIRTIGRALPTLWLTFAALNKLYWVFTIIPRAINRLIQWLTRIIPGVKEVENALGLAVASILLSLGMLITIGGGILVGLGGMIWQLVLRWGWFGRAARNGTRTASRSLRNFETGTTSRMRRWGRAILRLLLWPFDMFARGVVGFVRLIGRFLGGVVTRVRTIGGSVANFARTVVSGLGWIFRGLRGLGGGVLRYLVGTFTRHFGGRGILMGILRFFAGRGIGALFGPAGLILTIIASFAGRLNTFFEGLGASVHRLLGRILGPLFDGTWVERAYRAVQEGVLGFRNWTMELEAAMGRWILDFWNGLVEGIKDSVDWVLDWLKEVGKGIMDYLRSWGWNSPLKVTEKFGEDFMKGWARGLERYGHLVTDAVQGVGASIEQGGSVRLTAPDLAGRMAPGGRRGDRNAVAGRDTTIPELTIPIYIGGKKVDEYIVNVVTGEIREARRKGMARGGAFR